MNKRVILALFASVMMMALTGCCLSHEWTEATCSASKTCVKCGETEGEVLAHTWVEATCTEPKTCSVCGETEGDVLEHALTEANYQQAPTCTVCGETEGEPLQADFDKYGLVCDTELNKVYDYTTGSYEDIEITVTPKIVLSNYKIFDSDDNFEVKDGYEWRTVDVVAVMYDENALANGWNIGECYENYYDIVGNDESLSWNEDDAEYTFEVNFNGENYSECKLRYISLEKLRYDYIGSSSLRAWTIAYQVPKGYDGCVYGVRNEQVEWGEGQYINDIDNTDTLFFRFANMEDIKEYTPASTDEINLDPQVATKIFNNFYMNMVYYFDVEDDSISDFFDFNGDNSINQQESQHYLLWAIDKYNTEQSASPSIDCVINMAADYIANKLDVPDEPYSPAYLQ